MALRIVHALTQRLASAVKTRLAAAAVSAVMGVMLAAAWPAHAQTQAPAWPARPVKIVVPYPPGGPTDIVARVVGARLQDRLKQPVVIENRAGAGGNLGAEAAAKAPADGYTLLLGTTAHAINPSLFKSLGYDIQKDFVPVSLLTSVPLVLVAHPAMPVQTVQQLIALAKSRPAGSIPYASSGNGQSTHLAAELFNTMAGISLTHVPYKGSAPALVDVAGGQVSVMFDTMLSAMPQVKAGRLRAIAVTSAQRSAAAPELPTVAEAGLPGYEATAWNGMFAPAGTPAEVVALLNRTIDEILREPEVRQRFAADGADAGGGTAAAFGTFLRNEIEKWRKVVITAQVRID